MQMLRERRGRFDAHGLRDARGRRHEERRHRGRRQARRAAHQLVLGSPEAPLDPHPRDPGHRLLRRHELRLRGSVAHRAGAAPPRPREVDRRQRSPPDRDRERALSLLPAGRHPDRPGQRPAGSGALHRQHGRRRCASSTTRRSRSSTAGRSPAWCACATSRLERDDDHLRRRAFRPPHSAVVLRSLDDRRSHPPRRRPAARAAGTPRRGGREARAAAAVERREPRRAARDRGATHRAGWRPSRSSKRRCSARRSASSRSACRRCARSSPRRPCIGDAEYLVCDDGRRITYAENLRRVAASRRRAARRVRCRPRRSRRDPRRELPRVDPDLLGDREPRRDRRRAERLVGARRDPLRRRRLRADGPDRRREAARAPRRRDARRRGRRRVRVVEIGARLRRALAPTTRRRAAGLSRSTRTTPRPSSTRAARPGGRRAPSTRTAGSSRWCGSRSSTAPA